SRKMFPSTSSTQTPLARSATSLKSGRGYAGLTNVASACMICLPVGPGSAVLISGRLGCAITVVDIAFLLMKAAVRLETSGANFEAKTRSLPAREFRSFVRRRTNPRRDLRGNQEVEGVRGLDLTFRRRF